MRWALGAALLVAACAAHVETPRTATPHGSASAASATCGGCHLEAETAWRKSMHHASFTSPEFQAALHNDPLTFCTDCHAPRSADLGVDCVTCHTNAEAHEREAQRGSPKTAVMTTKRCASCHELPNPIAATMLQTTVTEHAASDYAAIACTECHRGHELSVTRNPDVLANALAYSVRRSPDGVVVSLRSKGVGHRFPTGDLFRALEVRCWIAGADGRILAETATSLHRDWDAVRRIPGTVPIPDTRLGSAPVEIALPLPSDAPVENAVLHVVVDYTRGANASGNVFTRFDQLRIADWTTPLR